MGKKNGNVLCSKKYNFATTCDDLWRLVDPRAYLEDCKAFSLN